MGNTSQAFPHPESFWRKDDLHLVNAPYPKRRGHRGLLRFKRGIASLTHSLMMSLSPYGITVNCISPGWIHTGDSEELSEIDHLQHPSRRAGTPQDIARLCIFLSLPDNDFINGADIPVDGGMTRKMIYQ